MTWLLGARAFLAGVPKWVWGAAAVALLVGGFALWLHLHDKNVIDQHELEREAGAGEAREKAGDERVSDAVKNAKSEQELHDVIENAPKGGELSPAARALSCARLRRVRSEVDLPSVCR